MKLVVVSLLVVFLASLALLWKFKALGERRECLTSILSPNDEGKQDRRDRYGSNADFLD